MEGFEADLRFRLPAFGPPILNRAEDRGEMHSAEDRAEVRLEGDMNLYTANSQQHALLEQCRQAAGREMAVYALDLSGVTEMDGCGLQLLVALKGYLTKMDCGLQLVNPSACVREALAQTRLAEQFPEANSGDKR